MDKTKILKITGIIAAILAALAGGVKIYNTTTHSNIPVVNIDPAKIVGTVSNVLETIQPTVKK
jgi:hypothetical protein